MTWLSQKAEPEPYRPVSPAPSAAPQVAAYPAPAEPRERAAVTRGMASIGKSLQVKGELTGQEDLAVEGKVEGKIALKGCAVTIGQTGRVAGEIHAKSVVVAGLLNGNISAEEMVEVAATGTMMGDIRAPRVVLADGAKFKGTIDMDVKANAGS